MSVTDLRDWIHETPLSQCGMSSDTCPDWMLAGAIAKLVRSEPLTPRERRALDRVKNVKLVVDKS